MIHEVQTENSDDPSDAIEADDAVAIYEPFIGRWNRLVSSTNWEKGRIISQWREALIDSGAPSGEYSDEAWARRVGGITSPHVGRLRRVFDAFGQTYESYPGLFWTHFLVAIDWDDAPLWLEGAMQSRWSVSAMRHQRWQAMGGLDDERPESDPIDSSEVDEDYISPATPELSASTQPAQGGGKVRDYDDGPGDIRSTPASEGPDFGDEESLNRAEPGWSPPAPPARLDVLESPSDLVQPFAGLPPLPADVEDAVELLKLAILRHKSTQWSEVSAETLQRYLTAFDRLITARPA